MVKYMIDIV